MRAAHVARTQLARQAERSELCDGGSEGKEKGERRGERVLQEERGGTEKKGGRGRTPARAPLTWPVRLALSHAVKPVRHVSVSASPTTIRPSVFIVITVVPVRPVVPTSVSRVRRICRFTHRPHLPNWLG